jgi:predicted cupin superfamily sugar epimerase
MIKGNGLFSP